MRAHSNEEIINKAALKEKNPAEVKENRIDVAVDLDDETGTCHTYVVTYEKQGNDWRVLEVNELSSL